MSWVDWAKTLTAGGKNEIGAILGKADSSIWGATAGFSVRERTGFAYLVAHEVRKEDRRRTG